MSTYAWMNKQLVAHLYDAIVVSNKKKLTIDALSNMDESQKNFAQRKKPQEKIVHVWFHIPYIYL